MVALFEGLGNAHANAAWEDALQGGDEALQGGLRSGSVARTSNGYVYTPVDFFDLI